MAGKMEDAEKLVDQFLYEKSSDSLIFRPHEYRLDGALVLEKGQLLKDIIAAANAWRRADTYILIGVEEAPAGKNRILGIISHLEEKQIVDFVNSKVQKPVVFSYHGLTVDRKKIGLIHIPLQERPFFLKEDFANLKKYVVYVRRGDSVQEAGTEEVARIKQTGGESPRVSIAPSFRVEFAHSRNREALGNHLRLKIYEIEAPDADTIPDYTFPGSRPEGEWGDFLLFQKINSDYYRELAEHYRAIGRVGLINFCVSNTGEQTARNLRLEIHIEDPERDLLCLEGFQLPPRPEKDLGLSRCRPLLVEVDPNLQVKWKPPFWMVVLVFNEIPSGKTVFTSGGIYLGGKASTSLDMVTMLSSPEMSRPLQFNLLIDVQIQKRVLDRNIICR